MPSANIEPERLAAAIRHARTAQLLLDDLRHRRSLWAQTRPLAHDLALPLTGLDDVLTILTDASADHWKAAPMLRSVVITLTGLADAEVAAARDACSRAYDAIAGT